ncbi:hypothetical protein [Bradyrhizobium sp. URHD0069]|uniref:hypothetical protein n=1 Tax=Bradyrhizobium sp. URHD0069 TaxID=1380355 RepID=UPI0012DCC42E|nr:hypothetical protein [Bradyrhizobium sp. URHD0069]
MSEINVAYDQRLMHDIRDTISNVTFESFAERNAHRMGEELHRTALNAITA